MRDTADQLVTMKTVSGPYGYPHHCLELPDLARVSTLILIDLEFTCWEGSLRDFWPNPAQPPEVIEVGLVGYDFQRDRVLGTYQRFVKPRINSQLSDFCLQLLPLTQHDIDGAPDLGEVVREIAAWQEQLGVDHAPLAEWYMGDRSILCVDGRRSGVDDPFENRPHLPVRRLLCDVLGESNEFRFDRDALVARLGVSHCVDRHSALADAFGLVRFLQALRKYASASAPR